jgi:uncharacterized protein (DUF1697 family)
MPHAVFLRAANVGGANVFRPAQLALALKKLDVVNIGAAGTFVVRSSASATDVRKAFESKLPHSLAMAICPSPDILALVKRDPFKGLKVSKDHRAWVAVLTGKATGKLTFPHLTPAGDEWLTRCDELDGRFALGQWRRHPTKMNTPGLNIEKALGVPITVRWWETIVKVAGVLEEPVIKPQTSARRRSPKA